jgi:hypothetical protein
MNRESKSIKQKIFNQINRLTLGMAATSLLFGLITGGCALSQESQNLALLANSNVKQVIDGNLKTFGKPIVTIKGDGRILPDSPPAYIIISFPAPVFTQRIVIHAAKVKDFWVEIESCDDTGVWRLLEKIHNGEKHLSKVKTTSITANVKTPSIRIKTLPKLDIPSRSGRQHYPATYELIPILPPDALFYEVEIYGLKQ